MKSLGVIVARGGSKRVPRKVLRQLGGHPVIAWMVRAALNSGLDRVVVSTEDDEIADVARSYGTETPFRRSIDLAHDDTRNDAVLLDALDRMEEAEGATYDVLVLLQSTSPFTQPDHIDACVAKLEAGDANCVFAARQAIESPEWMFRIGDDGTAERLLGGNLIGAKQLSQSHGKVFLPAGSIWAIRPASLRKHKAIYAPPLSIFPVPYEHSIDLDEEADFLVAHETLKKFNFELFEYPGGISA